MAEVRKHRRMRAARFKYDIRAMIEDARKRKKKSGCAGPTELGSPCVRAVSRADIRVSGRHGPRDGGGGAGGERLAARWHPEVGMGTADGGAWGAEVAKRPRGRPRKAEKT